MILISCLKRTVSFNFNYGFLEEKEIEIKKIELIYKNSILNDIVYFLELNFDIKIFENLKNIEENNDIFENEKNEVFEFENFKNIENSILKKDDQLVEDSDSSFCNENFQTGNLKIKNVKKNKNLNTDVTKSIISEENSDENIEIKIIDKKKMNKKNSYIIKRSYKEIYNYYKNIRKIYYCHFYPNFPELSKNNEKKIELFFNKLIQYFFIKKDKNLLYFFRKEYLPKNMKYSFFNEGFEFMKNLGKKYSESLFEKFSSFENIFDFSKKEKPENLKEMRFILKKELLFVNEIIKEILKILEILEIEEKTDFNISSKSWDNLNDSIIKIKNKKIFFLDFLKNRILYKFEVK